jgi:hypothetical protein
MRMNKKWSKVDIFILVLQVIAPVTSIIITCFLPQGQALSADVKLAIVGAGIVIPIILLQITITTGQNKDENDIKEFEKSIDDISDKINHISPILEQVFLTGNDRAKRFVYRRMDEVIKTIRTALSNNNSGNLRPSEYYEELLYLADLIISDHAEQKINFKGEVWAMTSFADEEWIEDEGYEKLWTEKLTEIVDKGIKTRRLCVVPDKIYNLISSQSFSEDEANKIKAFKGFVSYFESYYGCQVRKKIAEHYFIKTNDNPELTRIKGFFAIMLSSGELHILHGETVNESGSLTAKVLFDLSEIQKVRELFERYTRPSQELGKVISEFAKQNGFLTYLKNRNVEL